MRTPWATVILIGVMLLSLRTNAEDVKPEASEEPKKESQEKPAEKPKQEPWEKITQKDVDSIGYDEATIDHGIVGPISRDLTHLDDDRKKRLEELEAKLDQWVPGQEKSLGQMVRNWIALCTLQDLAHGEFEAELPYIIFERLKSDVPKDKLLKALCWVVLKPDEGTVINKAADLDLDFEIEEGLVRERSQLYAVKLMGRLLGKLPPKE